MARWLAPLTPWESFLRVASTPKALSASTVQEGVKLFGAPTANRDKIQLFGRRRGRSERLRFSFLSTPGFPSPKCLDAKHALAQPLAAIHDQHLAGDEVSVIGNEVTARLSNLFRCPDAAMRDGFQHGGAHL